MCPPGLHPHLSRDAAAPGQVAKGPDDGPTEAAAAALVQTRGASEVRASTVSRSTDEYSTLRAPGEALLRGESVQRSLQFKWPLKFTARCRSSNAVTFSGT